jgi:hypothetical protein
MNCVVELRAKTVLSLEQAVSKMILRASKYQTMRI